MIMENIRSNLHKQTHFAMIIKAIVDTAEKLTGVRKWKGTAVIGHYF